VIAHLDDHTRSFRAQLKRTFTARLFRLGPGPRP
jgi:hypothetical protein